MSSDNNNNNNNTTTFLDTFINLKTAGSDDIKTTSTASALEVKTTGSDDIESNVTIPALEVKDTAHSLSTLSLTDTAIYTTYSLAQLDSWITAYHSEAALVRDKIRPLTIAETSILEKLLTQRRGVENSMIHKGKYEEFMAKEKAKRREERH